MTDTVPTDDCNRPAGAGPVQRSVRPRYCPCRDETPDPCPACGATVDGNDAVRGVCQAWGGAPPSDYGLSLILVDRDGAPVCGA